MSLDHEPCGSNEEREAIVDGTIKERVNGVVDVFFIDWIDGYSICHDSLI